MLGLALLNVTTALTVNTVDKGMSESHYVDSKLSASMLPSLVPLLLFLSFIVLSHEANVNDIVSYCVLENIAHVYLRAYFYLYSSDDTKVGDGGGAELAEERGRL